MEPFFLFAFLTHALHFCGFFSSHLLLFAQACITHLRIFASLAQTLRQAVVDGSRLLQLFSQQRVDSAEGGTPGNDTAQRGTTPHLVKTLSAAPKTLSLSASPSDLQPSDSLLTNHNHRVNMCDSFITSVSCSSAPLRPHLLVVIDKNVCIIYTRKNTRPVIAQPAKTLFGYLPERRWNPCLHVWDDGAAAEQAASGSKRKRTHHGRRCNLSVALMFLSARGDRSLH